MVLRLYLCLVYSMFWKRNGVLDLSIHVFFMYLQRVSCSFNLENVLNPTVDSPVHELFYGLQSGHPLSIYPVVRGVATGGTSVYIPPKISNCFVHMWDINTCFEIAVTS